MSEREVDPTLDIAIVGMAGRFPGAPSIEAFWQLLREGREGIRFFEDRELEQLGVPEGRRKDPRFVPAAPLLDEFDRFDAEFFGYSPGDAALLDPQQRVFLECAWHALEDAGHASGRSAGQVGVFAGSSLSTYLLFNLLNRAAVATSDDTFPAMVANDKDFLSTRLSYHLGLEGPSVTVQTGCSTSLVAVHLACQHLLAYQCDLAIAGGVSVHMPQRAGYVHLPGGIGSADGHCRPYDARGTGTVFGSGVGVVVLRRLAEALESGDRVVAVIKGTAANNDGKRKVGYTAPSVEGQVEVIGRALALAGVEPSSIGYIEGHGTGTELGDPVEVAALNEVFGASSRGARSCALGSVKSNIGHLDAAAGVAGLIKAALAVAHAELPPTLHFEVPNPKVPWDEGPFFVNAIRRPWPLPAAPRRAGVSAFGIGGTNAHAIIEQAPPAAASDIPKRRWQLLPISATDPEALNAVAAQLADQLEQRPGDALADVAWTLQVGRAAQRERRIVVAETIEGAIVELRDPGRSSRRSSAGRATQSSRQVAFMFPGGGAQYTGMGRGLYEREPSFARAFDVCADSVARRRGIDLRRAAFGDGDPADDSLTRPAVALPALFAIEYALAQLWLGFGVEPVAMAGHSMGEYVAACLASVISLEDALELVCERGRLFETLPSGGMLSVALDELGARAFLREGVSIAALNGPRQSVLAGSLDAIAAVERELTQKGVDLRRIPIDVAAHSPMVEPILEAFERFVSRLKLSEPARPFVSGVTGTWITRDAAASARYWARHLRETVRFNDIAATLLESPGCVLLEVGPGRGLCSAALQRVEAARRQDIMPSMRSRSDDIDDQAEWLMAIGRLWAAGVPLDPGRLAEGERRRRVSLPGYPFRRDRHWLEPELSGAAWGAFKNRDPRQWLYVPSFRRSAPLPSTDHVAAAMVAVLAETDDLGVSAALIERLRATGSRVHVLWRGQSYRQRADGSVELPPGDRESYSRWAASLDEPLNAVFHCWNAGAVATQRDTESAIDTAFYSPLYLAQALEERAGIEQTRIYLLARGVVQVTGTEPLEPLRALALGPCRVLPLETKRLRLLLLDLAEDTSSSLLADRALAEWAFGSANGVVALRGRHRWQESYEPLDTAERTTTRLREGGTYLITGGLGDIGLALGAELARRVRARLILVGRTALPPRDRWHSWRASHSAEDLVSRRIAGIERIEAAGGTVSIGCADVSDRAAMARVLERTERELGTIHGVIHAAGLPAAGPFQLKTRAQASPVLSAKVHGARVLLSLFADRPLDFCMLFSSRSSIIGDIGQVDHCAANAFLDALAHAEARPGGTPVTTINWDTWRDIGQAVTTELPPQFRCWREELLGHAMTTEEALGVWSRVIDGAPPQVIISTQHLPSVASGHQARMQALLERATTSDTRERRFDPESYVAPSTKLERVLADIWSSVLGVDPIGVHDNFFELGGNSLLALSVMRAMRTRLSVDLPTTALFESGSIHRLAQLLAAGPTPAADYSERRDRGARRRAALESKASDQRKRNQLNGRQ